MSNQSQGSDTNNQPLFKNLDDQERIYAPEQVPGINMPPEEVDTAGTAGDSSTTAGTTTDKDSIAGADGSRRTVPVVAVRPDLSANTPVILPAATDEPQLDGDSRG